MHELIAIYRNALPAMIADLERARAEIDTADDSALQVRRIAHTLRGSGGTYGFPDVTAAAARVEDAQTTELSAHVDDLLDVLRSIVSGRVTAHEKFVERRAVEQHVSLRVLIVDDDPETRLLTAYLLGTAGHTVMEAAGAAVADAAVDEAQPDVILMDVMLGDGDGIDAAAALLNRSSPHVVPRVVFLTGAIRSEQLDRMNAAGAAGVIRKPFDPATFVEEFHRLLSDRPE